ncbi:PREDICTED: uncharacterized protein LOC104787666 isoform X2 [Camelina sativa]|uniref:Uncharacterized protein LOC104787666 isoform X2 n=1 Tax=Camelina sativa TaxID=90675 RepID=A0ABM0Z7N9_CAMSA|nr:PREDICTED: uncharacterized protein LOC104787666 isoform X2 [Camelina sativa]
MESSSASSSSPTTVTDSSTDSLAKDLQNQTLGAVDEGCCKVKWKVEDFNWDHSFVKELPGGPRTDVISCEEYSGNSKRSSDAKGWTCSLFRSNRHGITVWEVLRESIVAVRMISEFNFQMFLLSTRTFR